MTTINVQELTSREDTRSIVVHDLAAETIKNMFAQCEKIKDTFGVGEEYAKAVTSLHHVLGALLRKGWGNAAYVTKEDDLSLYVQEDGFVFGVIFFRDRKYDGTDKERIAGEWSTHS